MAFTSNSAKHSSLKSVGFWKTLPQKIPHSVILLNYGVKNHVKTSQDFLTFLKTETARKIFRKYDYQFD